MRLETTTELEATVGRTGVGSSAVEKSRPGRLPLALAQPGMLLNKQLNSSSVAREETKTKIKIKIKTKTKTKTKTNPLPLAQPGTLLNKQ